MPCILHLLYATDFHFPHVSSTLLLTLHYFTFSLNGSLPPNNDDEEEEEDEQGKNMSPYLIHTYWLATKLQKRMQEEEGKKKAKKVKIKKPLFGCYFRLLVHTHFLLLLLLLFLSIQSRFSI